MRRLTRQLLTAACCLLCLQVPMAGAEETGLFAHGITDLQYAYSDSEQTWLRRGPDKLRFDETDQNELQLGRLGLEAGYAFDLQSKFVLGVQSYLDPERSLELTEAYWQFKSLPTGNWKSRYRVGVFYPSISMENTGRLWTSPYTISSSAINTWLGEEVRTVGVEGKWTWTGDRYNRSKHKLSFFASLFGYNDPTGAMISWRGWSVHDRQTGVNGTLPMRDLPVVVFLDHSREFEPFMEIDDRPGIYAGVEWLYDRKLKVQVVHYDNFADDTQRQDDQYGWRTDFTQVGAHWRNDSGWEVLSQFMRGTTSMVDDRILNDFESAYLMGVKTWGRHRLALRIEYFKVIDLDGSRWDLNAEDGDAQTLGYSYLFRKNFKLSLEAIRLFSDHAARSHFGEEERRTEHKLLASLRFYF
jgi:hypothetical protein